MSGLILKDCYSLRKTFGLYSVLVLAFALLCIVTERYVLLPLPPVLIFGTMITGTFAKDRAVHWDKLAVTTGVGRSGIVRGKYLLFGLILCIGAVVSALFGLIGVFTGKARLISELEMLLIGLVIALISGSISLLLLCAWKGAADRIELVTVVSYAAGAGITAALIRGLAGAFDSSGYSFPICLTLSVIFSLITYAVSAKSFKSRDLT